MKFSNFILSTALITLLMGGLFLLLADQIHTCLNNILTHDATINSTPLHVAAALGQVSAVNTIINKSLIPVDEKAKNGWTALHVLMTSRCSKILNLIGIAKPKSYKIIAEKLISAGANVDAQDNYGRTPLMEAIIHNNPSMVSLLISKGANVRIKDNFGHTAIDLSDISLPSTDTNVENRKKIKQILSTIK